tara:strand:+ start:2158 stop:2481 length:324 start_codon:yes stop_codon:yes gene_type:complete
VSDDSNVREINPNKTLPGCILPEKAAAIEELFDWSSNFEPGTNPWCVFLDLTGFSDEEYGEPVYSGESFSPVFGYIELRLLGGALQIFETESFDTVYEWIRTLDKAQ